MIEVNGLKKSFGKVQAVDGTSFRAADAQITGLLGPNGAGKTTTLRMICTLFVPDAGTVKIDGETVGSDAGPMRRRLGVLPDARGLYRRLTARENIEYFGRLQGMDEVTLRTRTDALIAELDLLDVEHRRADGFSQGQRVKTAIARALVHDPQNLLLDEPTNGLDVMATRAMRELLRRLRAQGRCVLFSSHIMQEVSALCDRVVVLAHGRVVAEGTPEELRQQAGTASLEDAFVKLIGSGEGLLA